MAAKKMSRTFARALLSSMQGESVKASAFGNKTLLKQLEEDRMLFRLASGRGRAVYCCKDAAALQHYVRLQWGIADLEVYLELLDQDERDGEDSLQATTSTKVLRKRSMQGFFIKAFGAELKLDGDALESLPEGGDYFITEASRLHLASDVLVVGVENPECFQKAERLLHLFPQTPLVFVLRFYSNALLSWLESIQNNYLHFGDFDPAGIAIYCNEYRTRLGPERCRFFVPEKVESLIEQGQTALFDRQQRGWPPTCAIEQPELSRLIELIERYGKGVEQEALLLNPDSVIA